MGSKSSKEQPAPTPAKTKVGAGLLFICQGQVLLLKRSASSGNPLTWGLPGGNADPEDGGDLLTTAKREAREEIDDQNKGLPEFRVLGEILTKRGKNSQKLYTVFLCEVTPEAKATWEITLNPEHTDYQWFSTSSLVTASNVHPVVQRILIEPHRSRVLTTMATSMTK